MTVGMRVALKIAYGGAAFYGHQRQPDRRTVEGECLTALEAAHIIEGPAKAFFRSASRTDRGVSAIGNVIAFNSRIRADAVPGAFDDRARDVWGWAIAEVPDDFHPRRAIERWYRYHLYGDISARRLRTALAAFVGVHDFRAFTSDPPRGPSTIRRIDVSTDDDATRIDIRAPSFRRGMVRRIVAAAVAYARGNVTLEDIDEALRGVRLNFGVMPPEPLFLMDVRYDFRFRPILKPKAIAEWSAMRRDADLGLRFVQLLETAVGARRAHPGLRGGRRASGKPRKDFSRSHDTGRGESESGAGRPESGVDAAAPQT